MIKRKVYVHYWKMDKSAFVQCMTVFLVCVFVDPTYAIIVAIILGCLREAGNMRTIAPADYAIVDAATGVFKQDSAAPASSGQQCFVQLAGEEYASELACLSKDSGTVVVYRPLASWTFTNKTQHADRLGFLRQIGRPVMISLVHMHYMDLDGLDALRDIHASFRKDGVSLVVCDYNAALMQCLSSYQWYHEAVSAGTAHQEFATALKALQITAAAVVSNGENDITMAQNV
jgi:MFS superfamily sulfate permease-like transporter